MHGHNTSTCSWMWKASNLWMGMFKSINVDFHSFFFFAVVLCSSSIYHLLPSYLPLLSCLPHNIHHHTQNPLIRSRCLSLNAILTPFQCHHHPHISPLFLAIAGFEVAPTRWWGTIGVLFSNTLLLCHIFCRPRPHLVFGLCLNFTTFIHSIHFVISISTSMLLI